MERILANIHTNNIAQTISKVANNALDYGLRAILPDFIENDVIDIKNKFLQEGFIEGTQEVINKLEDVGKSVIGVFTGEFNTVEQIKRVVQKNGLLDEVSGVIDKILKKLVDKKAISKTTSNLIKNGKKQILNTLEDEIEGLYKETTYSVEKLTEYCNNWKEAYKNNDLEGMSKAMKNITKKLKESKIVENAINEARELEKIQKYIEESGNIKELTNEEKELLEKIN